MNPGAPIVAPSFAFAESHAVSSEHGGQIHDGHLASLLAWFSAPRHWKTVAIAASACGVCFALGTMLHLPSRSGVPAVAVAPPAATTSNVVADTHLDEIRALTADRDKLVQQHAELVSQLEAVNKARQDTEAALQQKIASLTADAAHDHDALAQQTVALNDRAAALQSQLEALRQKQAITEAALTVQEQETNRYRVSSLQAQVTDRPQLPQPNVDEVSSLVAARNLHIIDVYDSDGEGKRQRAFGRVFYVEGRSLVFYAYDLAKVHSEKKITFHVWGEHANNKETTLSLGVLHDDDPREQRWALTYDDPKVLAEINSVFVTIEPSNRDVTAPTGKTVLYAFLGGKPNHP